MASWNFRGLNTPGGSAAAAAAARRAAEAQLEEKGSGHRQALRVSASLITHILQAAPLQAELQS